MSGSPNARKRAALADPEEFFKLLVFLAALAAAVLLVAVAIHWASRPETGFWGVLRMYALAFGANAAFFGFLFVAHKWGLRVGRESRGRLDFDPPFIWRFDESGKLLAEIDTGQPFEWRHLKIENGHARYRLYQGGVRLEFESDESAASEIVTEVLGREWPPRRKARLHYSG